MGLNNSHNLNGSTTLHAVVAQAACLSPVELAELLTSDQAVRWERGERVLVEDYLELCSVLENEVEATCNLVYGEFLLREEQGESPSLEEYVGRFPHLVDGLRELHDATRLDDILPWIDNAPVSEADAEQDGCHIAAPSVNRRGVPQAVSASYRVVRPHSKGGLGEIFIAADEVLQREVALKEIQDRFAADPQIRSRFVQEAAITGSLEHPGIVPVYTLGYHSDGRPYYVMRFIRGESLRETARRYHEAEALPHPASEHVLAFRRLLARFQDVCQTIAYAHSRGILHRDIKPDNIMLGEFGETLVVDWGLAKQFSSSPMSHEVAEFTIATPPLTTVLRGDSLATRSGQIIGSPAYMSPEQAAGRLELLGPASDVYSLGATLYFLLTGRAPFEGYQAGDALLLAQRGAFPAPRQVQRNVDPALEAICLKAMALRPEDRYGSAQVLSGDLENWLADEPVSAFREGWSRRLSRLTRRYRAWTQTAAASLLVISIVSIGAALAIRTSWRQESQALNSSLRLSTRLEFDRALTLFDRGQASEGMLWLGRALKTAPPDADDLRRVIRANLANWQGSILPLRHVLDHKDHVYTLAFSPDGKALVSGSRDGTARIWNVATGAQITPPLKHGAEICTVRFSPNGDAILTGSHDGTARVWNAATGAPITPPLNVGAKVRAAVFSPDGHTVATSAENGAVQLWDARTGQAMGQPFKHSGSVWTVAFSPDGNTLASGSLDWTARLWDVAKGTPIGAPLKHNREVWCVAFSPNGKILASGSGDASVRFWNAHTGQSIGEPLKQKHTVWWLGFNPQGTALLAITPDEVSQKDPTAHIYDVSTQPRLITSLAQSGEAWAGAWSPDGTMIATGTDDSRARLWNAATGDLISQAVTHRGPVMAVAFSPNGQTFATGSNDSTVRLWNASALALPRMLKHQSGGIIEAVAFSPDGNTAFTGGSDHFGRFWDVTTGTENGLPLEEASAIIAAAYSSDGRILLTGCDNGALRLWDTGSRHGIGNRAAHKDRVTSVAFSPDGRRVITGSADRTARIWDTATGSPLSPPLHHGEAVNQVAFSPDGTVVLTCSNDQTARLWDGHNGSPRGEPLKHGSQVMRGDFSPDGAVVATGSDDGTVRLWTTAAGNLIREIRAHTARVNGVRFSPDGRRIVTGSADSTARLWDARSGTMIGVTMEHQGQVWAVAFSPDGQMVATGGDDRQAHLWDAWTGIPIGPALKHPDEVATVVFNASGRHLLTGGFNHVARLWPVAPPVDGSVEQIEESIRALTAQEFASGDLIRPVDLANWRTRAGQPASR